MHKFELVIPAFNEGKNLRAVIGRAKEAAEIHGLSSEEFCLVVVNNGSTDDSAKVLADLQREHLGSWFRVVTVERNQGYGYGLLQGLKASRSPIVGWSHADQQCDPLDAMKAYRIVEQLDGQPLLVKGERYERNPKDKFVSRVFEIFARVILGIKVYEMNAQPKVFPRELLNSIRNPPKTFAFDLYVLYHAVKSGYRMQSIPVKFPPRIHGLSNWAYSFFSRYKTIKSMIKFMLDLRRSEGRV